eukprot:8055031-Lingulodinium_polyedra.AAC.1
MPQPRPCRRRAIAQPSRVIAIAKCLPSQRQATATCSPSYCQAAGEPLSQRVCQAVIAVAKAWLGRFWVFSGP